jgi:hypothetical protein
VIRLKGKRMLDKGKKKPGGEREVFIHQVWRKALKIRQGEEREGICSKVLA